jgi:hypothetical protein
MLTTYDYMIGEITGAGSVIMRNNTFDKITQQSGSFMFTVSAQADSCPTIV